MIDRWRHDIHSPKLSFQEHFCWYPDYKFISAHSTACSISSNVHKVLYKVNSGTTNTIVFRYVTDSKQRLQNHPTMHNKSGQTIKNHDAHVRLPVQLNQTLQTYPFQHEFSFLFFWFSFLLSFGFFGSVLLEVCVSVNSVFIFKSTTIYVALFWFNKLAVRVFWQPWHSSNPRVFLEARKILCDSCNL